MTDDVVAAEAPEYTPKRRPRPTTISKEMKKLLGMPAPLAGNVVERKTWAELLAKRAFYQAYEGSMGHFKEIIDRTEGKVADRIAGHDGGPIGVDVALAGLARIYPAEEVARIEARIIESEDDDTPQLTDQTQEPTG